jgi:hypothetical protein
MPLIKRIWSGISSGFVFIYKSILFLEKHSVFVQLLILFILVCTLRSYLRSNELARESNDLNRKATMVTHTPWLSIDSQLFFIQSEEGKMVTISLHLTNVSDSPMLGLSGTLSIYHTEYGSDSCKASYIGDTSNDLMAHDSVYISNHFSQDNGGGPMFTDGIFVGHSFQNAIESTGVLAVEARISYHDLFGNLIKETMDIEMNPITHTYATPRTKITGFQSL